MESMNPRDLVVCPYNKAHTMLRNKLQKHVMKCKEIYKDEIELLICPFNNVHRVPAAEFHQHTKSCEDRKIILHYQLSQAAELNEETKHEKIEADENWDDTCVENYNPEIYASQATIVRESKGLFRAQRKQFIKQEHRRILGEEYDDVKPPKARKVK
ncbi:gametocyte-specific factor 1 homolog [Drosophila tropicalis]|uniref:gametocyte-specific factor 1 homolog n=1 Tax=Drosophila tropicalis TaxID=46794 RepID=UPI0035ABA71D